MPEQFFEDMGRKAQWFREIHGSNDYAALDRVRDAAVAHVQVMREARVDRLDPGGGPIDEAIVLLGRGGRARAEATDPPGHADADVFLTRAVAVTATTDDLSRTLKLRPRRGVAALDARTARLMRYDPEREAWALVDASGWNAQDRYVWGRVDRPGTYAAVALPKEPDSVRRVGLEMFLRRSVADAVATGHFASLADVSDRAAFRDYFATRHHTDQAGEEGRRRLDQAVAAHRAAVRELGRSLPPAPLGGNPQWTVLDDILVRLADLRDVIGVDKLWPYWPILARVANRVGPWFPLGPTNINGRVKSIAMHRSDSDILLAGAANGGVWKSTNGGDTWRATWKFEESLAIGGVAMAPSNGNVAYAGTGEDTPGWSPSYGGVGVFKSSDAGSTWRQIGTSAQVGSRTNKVVVHPTTSSTVYLATDAGVYRGKPGLAVTLGGVPAYTWDQLLPGRATDLVIKHDNPLVMLAGIHDDAVYKTLDGGAHWTRLTGPRVKVFAIIFGFTEQMPTGTDVGWIKLAIGRSGEGGSNFVVAKLGKNSATTLISADLGEEWLKTPGSVGAKYDEWCSLVAVHPRQRRHIYLASVDMKHSFDAWTYVASPGTHSDHHQMVFHRTDDDVAYVCCDGGVYRTTDNGSSWSLRSSNLVATQLMSLGVSGTGSFLVGSATQDQGIIQTNGSSVWADHGGGNEWGMFVIDPNDSNHVFVSPGDGQLRRSTNGGVAWSNPTGGLTDWWPSQNRNTKAASFAHVAVKPGNGTIVVGAATVSDEVRDANDNVTDSYAARHRIYRSTNSGVDWTSVFTLPHRGSKVAFSASDPTRAYVVTSEGRVYRSSDSGASWTEPASAANRLPAVYATAITVDPFDKNRVYVTFGATDPHLFRSTDGGATWAACNGTTAAMRLPNIALLDVVVDTENPDVLYVGSDIGVFRSNDRGSTWYWANDSFGEYDLPRVPVTGLGIHPATHRLYASTMGRGLYYTQATGIVSMRATHVRLAHEFPYPSGILKLRLTDGATTYTMTRQEVIRRIQAGTEVYTVGPDGTRARVRTLEPDRQHPLEYLSTAADATTTNNLLSLPRFYG